MGSPSAAGRKVAASLCVETHSVSKGQQYLQFFGSDALKRLHGCAIAEADRGTDSPCHVLAQQLRRPQIGFGNPQAPIVFISPSPLDVFSTSNEAFTEWLEHEARLEHHMTSETPHPYFQFVRAVLTEARRRMGQKLGKHDVLDFAFHTWAVRCATENPDRVTDGAINQCVDRHLQGLLTSISPQVVIAMGGSVGPPPRGGPGAPRSRPRIRALSPPMRTATCASGCRKPRSAIPCGLARCAPTAAVTPS